MPQTAQPDRLAWLLEAGLAALLLFAPLPFGAVGAAGRSALELGAFALLAVWLVRSATAPSVVPRGLVCIGLGGLVGLAALQALPLGAGIVSRLAPRAAAIRGTLRAPAEVAEVERRLIGSSAALGEPAATLSVDPAATASALRTGAALAALFLVATTVAGTCGVRKLALALLGSAAFQGLYGMLVVATGHDRIWNRPKQYFLDCATGTFVNRNHFACLLAMSLPCGLALVCHEARRRLPARARDRRPLDLLRPDTAPVLALGLLALVGLAGLGASFSRAGIGCGIVAVLVTLSAVGPLGRLGTRAMIALAIVALGLVPLMRIGGGRIVDRFSAVTDDFTVAGGRATVWRDTLALAADYPFAGCGFGTFAAAYPLYRSSSVRLHYTHAHNDLLQALAEGGVVGLGLLLVLACPVFGETARALVGMKGTLAVGFAAGLTAMLLHSLVDFNLHIPANAATASVLAGALEGLPWKQRAARG